MDGHAALPSSPSVSPLRVVIARRISGDDRDSTGTKNLFPIKLREHKQKLRSKLFLPARHIKSSANDPAKKGRRTSSY